MTSAAFHPFCARAIFAGVAMACALVVSSSSAAPPVDYVKDIKSLLKNRCYACHGALKQKADLRLDTAVGMRKGGDNGDILTREHSLLLERVMTTDIDERMPPEGEGSALTAEEITKLKAWLDAGAPAPADEKPEADPRAHWAYQTPKSSGQSLDALLSARLTAKQLKPQPPAAPDVWLRRAYVDLIGVPPTPAEISAFLQDTSSLARERVVDRLLASPQYGERWGRHFMDIWRYCDWYGLGPQLRHSQKHIWHWRDWIIESLNEDKGYDRMIVEMLAADELAPEDRSNLRATGFLARSYYLFNRTTWLDETIEHTSRAFLGVTMQCVKCHDHKYDPIDQADYYRMRAVFEPLHVRLDPWPGETNLERNGLPRVYDLHLERPTYRHVRGDDKNEDKSRALTAGVPEVLEFAAFQPEAVKLPATSSRPVLLPFVLGDQLRAAEKEIATAQAALETAKKALHPEGQAVVTSINGPLQAIALSEKQLAAAQAKPAMIRAAFAADQQRGDTALAQAAASAEANFKLAQAEFDLAKAENNPKAKDADKLIRTAREVRDKAKKKAAAPGDTYTSLPASLKAQEGPDEKNNATVQSYPETSTGRRLALARWMADRRNPLTARVLVNHLWTRHFGASLVPDVGDFGLRCPPPLHQDVLDTLAVDFMNRGWSMKHLHRVMVLSVLYARSSSSAGVDTHTLAADPDNACYWRMNPRRLESQAVRDSLLHIAGGLDCTLGGPSIDPVLSETSLRRSLYFVQTADVEHRFLATFDNSNVLECYRRDESVVPQQALALTNSALSRSCADALARKMKSLPEHEFVSQSFLTILGRQPTAEENKASLEGFHALKQNRSLFLQALLNHNDFVTLR